MADLWCNQSCIDRPLMGQPPMLITYDSPSMGWPPMCQLLMSWLCLLDITFVTSYGFVVSDIWNLSQPDFAGCLCFRIVCINLLSRISVIMEMVLNEKWNYTYNFLYPHSRYFSCKKESRTHKNAIYNVIYILSVLCNFFIFLYGINSTMSSWVAALGQLFF